MSASKGLQRVSDERIDKTNKVDTQVEVTNQSGDRTSPKLRFTRLKRHLTRSELVLRWLDFASKANGNIIKVIHKRRIYFYFYFSPTD